MRVYCTFAAALLVCSLPLVVAQNKAKTLPKAPSATKQANTGSRLSIQQIEGLISIRTPDEVVSGEIQSRGVAGVLDRAVLDKLRSAGAGPGTIAALLRLIPKAELTIHTTEGATILVNGQSPIVANDQGSAILRDLESGIYELRVTKPLFREFSSRVPLSAGSNLFEAPLEWTVGFLTIRTLPAEASIRISGTNEQPIPVENLPLPTGEHTITATAPYRTPIARKVRIEPGKTSTVEVSLDLDQSAVERLRNQIEQSAIAGNIQAVVQNARVYRSLAGQDPKVLKAVATVYLQSRSYQELPSAIADLLAAGDSFSFVLNHHHTGLALRQTHPARLTFAGSSLHYMPEGGCNTKEFTVSLASVSLETRATPDGYHFLTLSLPSPAGEKKALTMNFLDENRDLTRAIISVADRANHAGGGK